MSKNLRNEPHQVQSNNLNSNLDSRPDTKPHGSPHRNRSDKDDIDAPNDALNDSRNDSRHSARNDAGKDLVSEDLVIGDSRLQDPPSSEMNYRAAGVDVEAGDQLVDWLQSEKVERFPHADRIVSGIGGFASVFRLGFPEIKNPCLVSSTDGVGTKIKLAAQFETYESVGQDLVAMCVNDLLCAGAQPLFFLDYYATGKLDLQAAKSFLVGVRKACHESECALVGGETAEMPGLYHGRDFDAAGFAVGIVDENKILGAHRVKLGDHVIGVSSSGFHSNGYSLLRKVFERDLDQWRECLMTPTHLYAKLVLELVREDKLRAVANITGGGMENLPRVMPNGTCLALVDWPWPEPFCVVQDRTGMSRIEMLSTLNCGVGMALVVAPNDVNRVERAIREHGYSSVPMGRIEAANQTNAAPEVLY